MSSTSSSTPAPPATAPTSVYKGKNSRYWAQLPPEITRLVATYFLCDVGFTNFCPRTWEARELWPCRMVYTMLRDALDVERLMAVCPTWSTAIETHLFWQHACAVIDPNDTLAHHAVVQVSPKSSGNSASAPIVRITPYRHFRNMTQCSCSVCRINLPYSNNGLVMVKRVVKTIPFGPIFTCREHRKTSFCGICLHEGRDTTILEPSDTYNVVGLMDNEDRDMWPGIDVTCRSCRVEGLWRTVMHNPRDREAVGGSLSDGRFDSPDWETNDHVEKFIEMGEGAIKDVLALARERHWLRRHTIIADVLSQALAASRLQSREEGGYESDEDLSEEEDDPELIGMTEDAAGVKEIAITDWVRHRILDGNWLSPVDLYEHNTVPGKPAVVRAEHPCPWASFGAGDGYDERAPHPSPSTVNVDPTPTQTLLRLVQSIYSRQMRMVLLPAMANIVRRLVIESTADRLDPAVRVSKMTLEEVGAQLRDEGAWYNGIDWLERRANRRRAEAEQRRHNDEVSSTSSGSSGQHTTSPVLSTSTLQTTPSPPPKEGDELLSPQAEAAAALYPVQAAPMLLRTVPHVPVTMSHLPMWSTSCLQGVWREACAPLYQCRCSVCERAMLKSKGFTLPPVPAPQPQPAPPAPTSGENDGILRQVLLREEEEEESDGDGALVLVEELEQEEEDANAGDGIVSILGRVADIEGAKIGAVTPQKRDFGAVHDDVMSERAAVADTFRDGTPSKRCRTDELPPHMHRDASIPPRMRKRPSAELDDDCDMEDAQVLTPHPADLIDGESRLEVVSVHADALTAPRTVNPPPPAQSAMRQASPAQLSERTPIELSTALS